MDPLWLIVPGCAIWSAILLLPWRPWSTQASFDARALIVAPDLHDVTVLIPARNEHAGIERTLRSLATQGRNLRIILVDDQSTDGTAEVAHECGLPGLSILSGDPLPPGPFKPLLEALQRLQSAADRGGDTSTSMRIRTALVTARSAPAHERAIRTLMQWNINLDEAMFLGGLEKADFLREFEPDFFFGP